jgi:VanZ family protein
MSAQIGRRSLTAITIAYVALIFFVSSRPYLQPPGPEFPMKDKVAHTLEYGTLGLLLGFLIGSQTTRSRWVGFFLAMATGATIAACDELFQGTIPGRQMDIHDWMADVIGLSLAAGLVIASRRWSSRREAGR